MKIFLQTDFQKDWAKDKEMTGIFHFFSFVLRKHETRPLCTVSKFEKKKEINSNAKNSMLNVKNLTLDI